MLATFSIFMANITAAVPMSSEVRKTVEAMINAGCTVGAIVALLGGGSIIYMIVSKAFKKGATKLIIAA